MVYIFTALIVEAKPLIKFYELKKNTDENRYQLYENLKSGIRLVVTGVGQINMAIAATYILTKYEALNDDYVINIGICAGAKKGSYVINKITEATTQRTFYPDILLEHDFEEAQLLSGMVVKNDIDVMQDELYDMEAAAFYQSVIKYTWTDHIYIIKTVSDNFSSDTVSKEYINSLIEDSITKIDKLIEKIKEGKAKSKTDLKGDEDFIEVLSKDMHCSATMKESLKHLQRYLEINKLPYKELIKDYYEKGVLPCRDKKAGKIILDELQKTYIC